MIMFSFCHNVLRYSLVIVSFIESFHMLPRCFQRRLLWICCIRERVKCVYNNTQGNKAIMNKFRRNCRVRKYVNSQLLSQLLIIRIVLTCIISTFKSGLDLRKLVTIFQKVRFMINPFPYINAFKGNCSRRRSETVWQKQKLPHNQQMLFCLNILNSVQCVNF